MTTAELTEFLIAEIEAGNRSFVQQLLQSARAQILAGGGQIAPMTNASSGGKSFTRDVKMSCAEVAKACRAALDSAGPAGVPATGLDFSRINHLD